MKIGIFGGTFNPPHNGHVWAVKNSVKQLELDKIIVIPTGMPPHKKVPKGSATPKQRFEMTCLAAKEIPNAIVSDMELRRCGASYTADTVWEIKRQYPRDELYFIMGTDMLLTFDKWFMPKKIISCCRLAVIARQENDFEIITKKASELKIKLGAYVSIVRCQALDVSSTEIRNNQNTQLPEAVAEYIEKNGLYK